jgi:hypothetical protein
MNEPVGLGQLLQGDDMQRQFLLQELSKKGMTGLRLQQMNPAQLQMLLKQMQQPVSTTGIRG